jgi:L-arabinose isomerase
MKEVLRSDWWLEHVLPQAGTIGRALKFVRFGDNMRYVAVTDGDKVEAELRFGYSVNTHGIGDLVKADKRDKR